MRLRVAAGLVALVIACALGNAWLATRIAAHRIASEPGDVTCLGTGSTHVVYLHGIDTFGPSWQELENRRTVARLADDLGLAIAIPRAPGPCWNSSASRCWPQDTAADTDRTLAIVRDAAQRCFGSNANLGVLGFSNGGFAIAAAYRRCATRDFAWVVISGAGSVAGDDTAADLAPCGRIAIVIGDRDRAHRAIATELAAAARARHGNVDLVEFDGGHRLDVETLRGVLATLVGRR